ncbi:hypothetical protein [Sphingobacterium hungaricum]
MNKVLNYILLFSSLIFFNSCGDGSCNVVPSVSVYSQLSQGSNPEAFVVGGSATLAGGVSGILVYCSSMTGINYNFIAYDRCSTVNPEERNQVILKDAYTIQDPVSGAEWLLVDGSPAKIATCPLKPYVVTRVGSIYYVQN